MNPLNQVNIEEKETIYDVKLSYHSDMKCQNYDVEIVGVEHADGSVTLKKPNGYHNFEFFHSDPDRVIAIAQMMLSFAQMAKNENKKDIDTSVNE